MSILILNQTVCSLCGNALREGENILNIPAFVINIKEPIYFFSDNNFHKDCLLKHPLGEKVIKYSNLFIEQTRPENRICIVSKELITHFENHLFIEFLTSKEEDFLQQFNFIHINRKYIPIWESKNEFLNSLKHLKSSTKWKEDPSIKFVYLDGLINELSRFNT